MKVKLTDEALTNYESLPPKVRKAFDKQALFLIENIRYPSLRAKRYIIRGNSELWQARVDQRFRFFFEVRENFYLVVAIVDHPK